MDKESRLGRAVSAIGRVFSRSGGNQESVSSDDPMQGFTKMERDMLRRASKIGVVYGNYREAGELSVMVLKARAERLKVQQSQVIPGGEADHQLHG